MAIIKKERDRLDKTIFRIASQRMTVKKRTRKKLKYQQTDPSNYLGIKAFIKRIHTRANPSDFQPKSDLQVENEPKMRKKFKKEVSKEIEASEMMDEEEENLEELDFSKDKTLVEEKLRLESGLKAIEQQTEEVQDHLKQALEEISSGKLTKDEAEKHLKPRESGTWLIRWSPEEEKMFATVKMGENYRHEVLPYCRENPMGYLWLRFGKEKFLQI